MPVWFAELLVLGVMAVNGFTDAPNAIAAVVSTGTLGFKRAVALAAVCDFLGAVVLCAFCPTVARTVLELADFGADPSAALPCLEASFLAIILWATLAWRFGLPTSESHALLAGLTGACAARFGDFSHVSAGAWAKVLAGLALSTLCGALAGKLTARRLERKALSPGAVRRGQLLGAAVTAFFHGAQDGQKFIALFLLCRALGRGEAGGAFITIPLPVCALCAGCMAAGTALGGRRIIDTVTRGLTGLTPKAALAADLGSGACLLAASVFGLPVSTTHTKLSALWGAGRDGGMGAAGEVLLAWLATFPACFGLAWALARVMVGV